MPELTKDEALKIITDCADRYKENLVNKTVLFLATDKHKRVSGLEVTFEASNFLHLTGVTLSDPSLTALRFYERCVAHRLKIEDFDFPDGTKAQMKLAVMPMLFFPHLSARTIGQYNGKGHYLYTEKIAGNVKGCMGFVKDSNSEHMIPNTILREDIRAVLKEPYRIIATYRKKRTETAYSECVYVADKVDWSRIKYPKEYEYLPLPEPKAKQEENLVETTVDENVPASTFSPEQEAMIDAYVSSAQIFIEKMHMDIDSSVTQLQVPSDIREAVIIRLKK